MKERCPKANEASGSVDEWKARAESAESALAAKTEECERLDEACRFLRGQVSIFQERIEDYQNALAALRARADDAERVESVACDVWSQIGPGLSTGWSWAQLVGTYPEIANGFREKIRAVLAAADGREP